MYPVLGHRREGPAKDSQAGYTLCMSAQILVVDDELSLRKVLQAQLTREGYEVEVACDGGEAIRKLQEVDYHLVISDLKMPGVGGMELLEFVRTNHVGTPVILITAHGTIEGAIEALKLGAQDFICKPYDIAEVRSAVEKALSTGKARQKNNLTDPIWSGVTRARNAPEIVGTTPAMQRVYALVQRVADTPSTVLVTGESGTGKELAARAIHALSNRKDRPFIAVNCGAIPENLFESELFGYEKGAFTGASTTKPGKFELAHTGTLFLDEVGELPRDMQVKLLRALQDRAVERVGGIKPVLVDVRVIAATNVDLVSAVANGRFREDLFYRLNVIPLRLPPLRERKEDIPLLVEHFMKRHNVRLGKNVTEVSRQALDRLMAWSWPGNIRELENVVERGVLFSEGSTMEVDLPDPHAEPSTDDGSDVDLKEWIQQEVARLERSKIQKILDLEGGNVTRAARRLHISRKGLQLKMKEYGLREEGEA